MRVLLAGVPGNSTLSAARALATAGHRVELALSASPRMYLACRTFFSRHVSRYRRLADPALESDRFAEGLLKAAREGGHDIIVPMTVEQSLVMWDHEPELARFARLALIPRHLIELAHDKKRLFDELGDGFALPRTYTFDGEEDLLAQVSEYPVAVKPRRGSGAYGLRYARNADELRAALRLLNSRIPENARFTDCTRPVVQEVIPGKVHDALCLFNRGEPRAIVVQRRDTVFPVHGGISVDVTVLRDPALADYATAVLRRLQWHGVCNFECIRDERSGIYRLLEINPRFWGVLDLTIKAGVNFPLKFCELVMHGDTAAQHEFREGLTYTVLFPLKLFSIVQDRGNRRAHLRTAWDTLRGRRASEMDWRDPLPSLMRMIGATARVVRNHRALRHPPRHGGER